MEAFLVARTSSHHKEAIVQQTVEKVRAALGSFTVHGKLPWVSLYIYNNDLVTTIRAKNS